MPSADAIASPQPSDDARAAHLRVLHVIDPRSPGGGACTLRLLADHIAATDAWDHTVVVAGDRWHLDLSRRCGVKAIGTIAPHSTSVGRRSAIRALQRVLAAYEAREGRFDFVHAWTIASGDIARAATTRRPMLATIPIGPVDESERRALRRFAFAGGTLIAAAAPVTRECLDAGIPESQLIDLPAGVDIQRAMNRSRTAVRRRWNAADGDVLAGLIGQPSAWPDARMALAIVAPLMAVPHPIRLVVFPDAARRAQAMRWIWRLDWPQRIILDDELAEPWQVVAGLDVVLALGATGVDAMRRRDAEPVVERLHKVTQQVAPSHRSLNSRLSHLDSPASRPAMGTLPILHAMAAGLPVITDVADDQLVGILVDKQSGFRVLANDISAAMERVLRLIADPDLRRRMGIAARQAVMTHASIEAFTAGVSRAAGRLPRRTTHAREDRLSTSGRTDHRTTA